MTNFSKLSSPFIVAEIGNNHEGSLKNAIKLIYEAKKSGADAVKFQIFKPKLYSNPRDHLRIKTLNKFLLKKREIIFLKKLCDKIKIIFFATPFDIPSAIFLNKIQKIFKISSGDNNYIDLIKKIITFRKPIILSTGLLNFKELKKIDKIFKENAFYQKKQNLCFMHCVSAYPASKENINLKTISFFKKKFRNITIGYSDHTLGVEVPSIAYSLGASVIEKHFTLSNNFSNFRDHKISLNPKNFKRFVNKIKKIKIIMGKEQKLINQEELKNINTMRRKIALNKKLSKGNLIKKQDLLIVRSSERGIFADNIENILGKKLKKNKKIYENLNQEDFFK